MNPNRIPTSRTGASARSAIHRELIATSDRGMIMVMSIPMCLFLTGALWYIAGIGDAVLFRERMQEASDAVAFSTVTLEARGMNILVLLNLVMAAIEAILVALNLIMFATLAVAAILGAIGAALSAFGGAGAPFLAAAQLLLNFYKGPEKQLHDNVVKPGVMDALSAIHDVESEIPSAVPVVAQAAALEIATMYQPTINPLVGGLGVFVQNGNLLASTKLPVKWGTTKKLCMKSFDALTGVMDGVAGGGALLAPVKALASAIGVSDFFCELGGGGSSPDISAQLNDLASGKCDENQSIKDQCKKAADEQAAVSALQSKCGSWSSSDPNAGPPPDPQCPNLTQQQLTASADQQQCDDMKQKCKDGANKGASDALKQAGTSQSSGNSQGKEPSAVDHANWWNGCDKGQILAVEYGDGASTKYSPKFVKIGSRDQVSMSDPDATKGQTFSASQAEFFYDCTGSWDSCDKDEEALWNFHWRARFRLTNPKIFGFVATTPVIYLPEGRLAVKVVADIAAMSPAIWNSASPARVQLGKDLTALTPPMSMSLH